MLVIGIGFHRGTWPHCYPSPSENSKSLRKKRVFPIIEPIRRSLPPLRILSSNSGSRQTDKVVPTSQSAKSAWKEILFQQMKPKWVGGLNINHIGIVFKLAMCSGGFWCEQLLGEK